MPKYFQGMKETIIIMDDLVVFDQTQKEDDKNIQGLLKRYHTAGVKLISSKFEVAWFTITFIRY